MLIVWLGDQKHFGQPKNEQIKKRQTLLLIITFYLILCNNQDAFFLVGTGAKPHPRGQKVPDETNR